MTTSPRESAPRLLPLAVHDLGEREHGDGRFVVGGDGEDGDDFPAPPRDAVEPRCKLHLLRLRSSR